MGRSPERRRKMTKSQEKAIEKIRQQVIDGWYSDELEFKQFEIEDCRYFVSVFVESGMKGDEGTLAAVFSRDCAHFFVGKRGGITYPVWDQKKKKQYRRQYKNNIYRVYIDQK